jgi:hypothetical protein
MTQSLATVRLIILAMCFAGGMGFSLYAMELPSANRKGTEEETARKLIVAFRCADLASFERNAAQAKQLGATHVVITDDIPDALWQLDPPNDPYPAWFMHHPGLLKVFPPKSVQPFVNLDYADKVAQLFAERCKILRRLGLRAYYNANEPQVMPEAFFTAYPELRGPRVDQANRSRTARFAPCVDHPETLRLYRESVQLLVKRCPEIEIFNFMTTDAGSGFCWAAGLYPGKNGNTECQNRRMEDRVSGFLMNLQQAGLTAGGHLEVNLTEISPRQWMQPTFDAPMAIVRMLPRGLAVNGLEGPDGRRFLSSSTGGGSVFYPVVGLPRPIGFFRSAPRGGSGRQWVRFGDAVSTDFYMRLFQEAQKTPPPKNEIETLTGVRLFAASMVGEEQADDLLSLWLALDEVERRLEALDFGPVLKMGHLLGRWLIRPMVPFPEELTPQEKSDYRRFLFQAKGEAQADNLIDLQAMRMFEGWGAKMLVQRVIEGINGRMRQAMDSAERLRAAAKDEKSRHEWSLLGKRLAALQCLIRTVDHMISYQAQLDRVRNLGVKPELNPVIGVQSSWDRTEIMQTARSEIDNTIRLMRLLESTREPLLDTAPVPEEETIMRLGPDLAAKLKRKIDIMNAHWEDYKRWFTTPNP